MENLLDRLDVNLDDPTPEETEMHQELAREIELSLYWRSEIKKENKSVFYNDVRSQIRWLRSRGYNMVNVKGGRVSFEEALRRGFERNIFRMYERVYNSGA